MKIYTKIINNRQEVKPANRIIIIKDGFQTINPTEEMILADGWVEYTIPTYNPSEEELVKTYKIQKLQDLYSYDESSEVNDCIIIKDNQELHYWANKTDRDSLKGVVRDYISLGKEKYRLDLRELGIYLTIPCELLLGMLAQLEVYAAECYNKTTDHTFAINQLTTVEEIENYNFRTGYPEKLTFKL